MTISLCVILLEATGNMANLLPLMLALMAARWVGNVFNEGLYDIHIHLKRLPYLDEDVSRAAASSPIMMHIEPRALGARVRGGEDCDGGAGHVPGPARARVGDRATKSEKEARWTPARLWSGSRLDASLAGARCIRW
jgi:hypothetical protein